MMSRHLIRLWAGDMERLKEIYHTKSANSVIRDLVRAHIERVEIRLSAAKAQEEFKRHLGES